jgi:hypothetical protein
MKNELTSEARARGRARQAELAIEMKEALKHNIEALLSCLDRPANALERTHAEMYCSLMYRAAKMRDRGQSDLAILRQACLLMKEVPFLRGPVPAAPTPATEQD